MDAKSWNHELRTPFNHLVGYSEMLSEEAQYRGQTDLAAIAQQIRDCALFGVDALKAGTDDDTASEAARRTALLHAISPSIGRCEGLLHDFTVRCGQGAMLSDVARMQAACERLTALLNMMV